MHDIHFISLAINVANIIIAAVLLSIYAKNYRHIGSNYNLGLMIFSTLFIFENLISAHLIIFSWSEIVIDLVILHNILINSIELLGLLTLLYITWK